MSSSTRSNGLARSFSIASRPFSASVTTWPSLVTRRESRSRFSGLSSTTRISAGGAGGDAGSGLILSTWILYLVAAWQAVRLRRARRGGFCCATVPLGTQDADQRQQDIIACRVSGLGGF